MVVEPWPRGRCERWTSARSMCGKAGRWMVDGEILCGGCKREKARVTTVRVTGVAPERVAKILELAARGHELYEMSDAWSVDGVSQKVENTTSEEA